MTPPGLGITAPPPVSGTAGRVGERDQTPSKRRPRRARPDAAAGDDAETPDGDEDAAPTPDAAPATPHRIDVRA